MSNRLINEKSPYLLQHADNLVDWYAWGEEAFRKARSEDKPVFLSIGYSTCHWCHVMEHESFSNPEVAAVLNKYFVSIKVDREERPDVDRIYMSAVQAMTGTGGWPLSVWLTPDLKPFFGGTYFPPIERAGRPGLVEIAERIAGIWKTDRPKLVNSGEELSQVIIQSLTAVVSTASPASHDESLSFDLGLADGCYKAYLESYDPDRGGFSPAPKFPMPVNHNFLVCYHHVRGEPKALEMAANTLRKMYEGGIYDHIGGGFHRYSTDADWHVPHFEKMLYDNAQLAVNYLDLYRITYNEDFARAARETLDYLLRDMFNSDGGFYSAEDADSLPHEPPGYAGNKVEGAFYVWGKQEIINIAGDEAGEIFSYRYGVSPVSAGRENVLHIVHTIEETSAKFAKDDTVVRNIIEETRQKLFEARSRRPRPHRDDKILVSWNGQAISAFSKASRILGGRNCGPNCGSDYLNVAVNTAVFIKNNLYDSQTKRLHRHWREGKSEIGGIADDYAFLVQGLIDLYEASSDAGWLAWAIELTEQLNALFLDTDHGGFYMTAAGHDINLLARIKDNFDNVEPCAGSVAAQNLLRLARLAGREDFHQCAEETLLHFKDQMKNQPRSLPQMMVALMNMAGNPGLSESPDANVCKDYVCDLPPATD